MNRLLHAKIFTILAFLLAACVPDEQTSSQIPITVQLGSVHQAVYGGFYLAQQKGTYAESGMMVTFVEGGNNVDLVSPLLNGDAQFGIMGASALISERAAGKPVRALATIFRRDPIVFFSLADSGIIRLQDFIDKNVLVTPRLQPRLNAMLAKAEISLSDINIISTGNVSDLYTGKIDVASGLITSSVLSAQRSGYPVNIIYPDDYGVHFYSTVIFATEDYIAANPELVEQFLQATFKGWSDAVEDPQSVGAIVKVYNPAADAEFESASMAASLPYIHTGEDYIGWMKPEVWAGMLKTMREQGEVTSPLDIEDVYTMEFIQQIYGENNS